METLVSEMESAETGNVGHNEIVRVLMDLQDRVNSEFLRPYSNQDVSQFFSRLWKFLVFAGAHQNTSVRLAAYRTTGVFLLKVAPYRTAAIHSTFSDIVHELTLSPEIKGSAVIASAFSFISNFNAGPYLQEFLNRTPVFHHFSISDPVFFDHLAPIIRNLGRLGIEWLTGLLHSFLGKLTSVSDRYLILSIAAVMKHDPLNLMKELIAFVRKQSNVKEHLSLISYLFSVIECKFEGVDLWDVAEAALDVLSSDGATQNDIDSSFQILGFESASFSLSISNSDEDSLKLVLVNQDKTIEKQRELKIEPYVNRPSFYCLPLPLKLLRVKENDGVLQLTAKFRTMARLVNNPETPDPIIEEILDYFIEFMSRNYDDKMSAAMQGLSMCLPVMLRRCETKDRIMYLISRSIFTKCQSWYHASDIIRIIKVIPVEYFGKQIKLTSVIDQLLEYSMNRNERLQARAKKAVVRIVNAVDFERYSSYIANKIDYHDSASVMTHLDILTMLLTNAKGRNTGHLRHVIMILLEAAPLYDNSLDLMTKILMFFGSCDLSFLENDIRLLQQWFSEAVAIIYGSLFLLTGQRWNIGLAQGDRDRATEMMAAYLASMNYDMISETSMDYAKFLAPFAAAVMFLSAIPVKGMKLELVMDVFNQTYNFFPFQATRLMHKYWNRLKKVQQVECLERLYGILEYIQDYGPATIWCALFMTMSMEQRHLLGNCTEKPGNIARWAIHNSDFHGVFYGFDIFISDDITDVKTAIEALPEADRNDLYSFLERNFPIVMKKLNGEDIKSHGISMSESQANFRAYDLVYGRGEEDEDEKTTEVLFEDAPEVTVYEGGEEEDTDAVASTSTPYPQVMSVAELSKLLSESRDDADILVKTQLRQRTFEFPVEKLQSLLLLYCAQSDITGIVEVLRYAFRKSMKLSGFADLIFPEETLPMVLQYLAKVKSPEFYDFSAKIEQVTHNNEIDIALKIFDPQSYIQHIEDAEKLHKSEVVMFCRCISRTKFGPVFDPKVVTRLTRKFLDASGRSEKRKSYNAFLILVVFHLVEHISDNFMDTCSRYIRENIDFISHDVLSKCLLIMNSRITTGKGVVELVKTCLERFSARTSHQLICHQVMLSFPTHGLPERELLSSYVESTLPSLFCRVVQYIFFAMYRRNDKASDDPVQQILKRHLKTIITQVGSDTLKFMTIEPIAKAAGGLFEGILAQDSLKRHHEIVIKMCSQFIPRPDRASFIFVSGCLPRIIRLVNTPTIPLLYVIKQSDSLVTVPMSESLFKVYIRCLQERLEKCPDDKSKDDFLINMIDQWRVTCVVCDCAAMTDVVYEWMHFIHLWVGPYQMSTYILLIYKAINRFFPFYVAFVRLLRKDLGKDIQNGFEFSVIPKQTFAVMAASKCRKLAFLLMEDKEYARVALDLALFDKDCEESEAMINGDPKLGEILSSLNE